MDGLNAPLEDLVFSILNHKSGMINKYSKNFFEILTAYAFEKTHLSVKQHFLPRMHVSNILDCFARNDESIKRGMFYLENASDRFESFNEPENILSFCDTVIFFSGFLPEYFSKKPVSIEYYQQLAKQGFYTLHNQCIRKTYLGIMGVNFHRYVRALSFLRSEILSASFSPEEKYLIH